jgi:hypothetical protein
MLPPEHAHTGAEPDDALTGLLRSRLREADRSITVPPDLLQRVMARQPGEHSAPDPGGPVPQGPVPQGSAPHGSDVHGSVPPVRSRLRRRMFAVGAVAAVALVTAALTALPWLLSHGSSRPVPAAQPGQAVVLHVYNVRPDCRQPAREPKCGLDLAGGALAPDPAGPAVGQVWNGDALRTDCVDPEGPPTTDGAGMTSTRWYHVTTTSGSTGWLPGVRTRNSTEVPLCRG